MTRIPHIYIADSYAHNTGDLGILFATIQELKKNIPGIRLSIESSHPNFLQKYDEVAEHVIYPRLFNIENIVADIPQTKKIKAMLVGIRDVSLFTAWALASQMGFHIDWILPISRHAQGMALRDADIILSSGGGFLSSRYRYVFRLHIYGIGYLLYKKVVIFAQSIGPFETSLSRILIPLFIKHAHLITVREPWTLEYLQTFLTEREVHLVNDIAYLLERDENLPEEYSYFFSMPTVAYCVKATNDPMYMRALIASATLINKHGYRPLIISQTPADDSFGQELATLMGVSEYFVPFGINPRVLKTIYGKCEFIIASRMHAIIFAAEQGVPFISISYEPKFIGLIQQLDYDTSFLIQEADIFNLPLQTESMIFQYKVISKLLKKKQSTLYKRSQAAVLLLRESKLLESTPKHSVYEC